MEHNLSGNQTAALMGVSPASLSAWLNGKTEPPLRIMEPLSSITGLTYEFLCELAGYMPHSLKASSFQVQASAQLRSDLMEMRRWIDLWTSELSLGPAATIAGLLHEASLDWKVSLLPDVRGRTLRVHHATYIGVEPQFPVDEAATTQNVESALADQLFQTGTTWRRPRRVLGWRDAPYHVLTTPHIERTRAPGLTPYLPAPPSVLIVGVTYAHAETVAALLADAWDYGFQNTVFATMQRDHVRRAEDPERATQARLIRSWLQSPPASLDRTVWTFGDVKAVRQVLPSLRSAALPAVAAVFAGPRILTDLAATMWGHTPEELIETQDALKETLLARPEPVESVTILDEEVEDEDGAMKDDLLWDAAVRAAWKLLRKLTPDGALSLAPRSDLSRYAALLRNEGSDVTGCQ